MKKVTDKIFQAITYMCATTVLLLVLVIIGHILIQSIPAVSEVGGGLFDLQSGWRPISPNPRFSLMPAIAGTLYVSALGVAFALIFGVACAFWLNFYLPKKLTDIMLSFIDLVAGIPSVIFGFIGLTLLVKWFQTKLHMPAGQCVLAAGIMLGVMLLPFVVSTCSESIQRAREKYEFTALALGYSKEMVIQKIIFPSLGTSLMAATMMALGRALGETMAVMMCVGNSPIYPKMFGRGQTIASLTALEMGSIEYGSIHLSVLYTANLILLIIMGLSLFTGWLLKRKIEKAEE